MPRESFAGKWSYYSWLRLHKVCLWSKGQFFKLHFYYSMEEEWNRISEVNIHSVHYICALTTLTCRRKSWNLRKRRGGNCEVMSKTFYSQQMTGFKSSPFGDSWGAWEPHFTVLFFFPSPALGGLSFWFFLVFLFCDWDSMTSSSS